MTALNEKWQSVIGKERPCKILQRQMVEIRATAKAKVSFHSWHKVHKISLLWLLWRGLCIVASSTAELNAYKIACMLIMLNSTKIPESLPKGGEIHQESETWDSITVFPDQMGPSALKPLFPLNDGTGLIELTRCVMFDITDWYASWFVTKLCEKGPGKVPLCGKEYKEIESKCE